MNLPSINLNNNIQTQLTQSIEPTVQKLAFGLLKPFPKQWGNPPAIQTSDWVELPAGFGQGSSTLRNWILSNLDK